MPRISKFNAFLDQAIELYLITDKSLLQVAKHFQCNADRLSAKFKERGVTFKKKTFLSSRPRKHILPETTQEIIQLYQSGKGTPFLSKKFGLNIMRIRRILIRNGTQIRNHAQSAKLVFASRTPEDNLRYTANAHTAVRGSRRSYESRRQGALTRETTGLWDRNVSEHEKIFYEIAESFILQLTPQKAINTLNVDFALDGFPITVEIFGSGIRGSLTSYSNRFTKRSKTILDAGYSQIIIWALEDFPIDDGSVEQVITIRDLYSLDPTSLRQQYVILGNGETTTFGSSNLNYLTGILSPHNR